MNIEKTMFKNSFNIVIDVKGKTKEKSKVRMDIALFCHRKNMELVYVGSLVAKLKASFSLEKQAQFFVYLWLKSLYFSDGRTSNIPRLVNLKDWRLYGMKSPDCHVFMQTLIPLVYQDLLPKEIQDALMKIIYFFRDICSNKLET
jgi:hypothetical protein